MNREYRILHTADWHLGKLLHDRSRQEEHRRFLEWLVTLIQEERIDALILAGDLFDSAHPSNATQRLYYDFVCTLSAEAPCVLVVIAGNHDSPAQLEAPGGILRSLNAHVVGFPPADPADALLYLPSREDPAVAVATVPFLRDRDLRTGRAGESAEEIRAALTAGIAKRYLQVAEEHLASRLDCPLIGMGHLTVTGSQTSSSEREIHIGGLGSVSSAVFPAAFSYVALGHLHRPQTAGGDSRVRYSGSPLPLSFSEAGDRKEVCVVAVTGGEVAVTTLAVPPFRSLLRLSCRADAVEATLAGVEEGGGGIQGAEGVVVPDGGGTIQGGGAPPLEPWIELTVGPGASAEEINERVRLAGEGRRWEVLKVQRERTPGSSLPEEQQDGEDQLGSMIDDPAAVFALLLEGRVDQEDQEARGALTRAFAQLLEQVQEENR